MRIRNARLTGAHYFKQRLLGGKDLWVQEEYTPEYDDPYGGCYIPLTTTIRWRKATDADWIKLRTQICE